MLNQIAQRHRLPLLGVLMLSGLSWTGCAAIDPPSGCRCGHCQHRAQGPDEALVDLARMVERHVIGVDYEAPFASDEPGSPQPLPLDLHGPLSDLPASPAEPIASPPSSKQIEGHRGELEQAAYMAPEPPPVCGPPPRFFPVPARPVFSTPAAPTWLR